MPELLAIVFISLGLNLTLLLLWWQSHRIAERREALNYAYAQAIRRRNGLIMRLCRASLTKELVAEAEACANTVPAQEQGYGPRELKNERGS